MDVLLLFYILRSRTNDALQANLDKVEEIKDKVESNLKREILVDQKAKEEILNKEARIKSLLNDLDNSKQAGVNCRDDLVIEAYKLIVKILSMKLLWT
jgi:hypothetical protein